MSQYKTGTVNVSSACSTVTGNLSSWSTSVISVGDAFSIRGENAIYTIASIIDSTKIVLTTNYSGVTSSAKEYQITTDFTPNLGFGEVWAGDRDWPFHLTVNTIRMIDSYLAAKHQGKLNKSVVSSSATVLTLSSSEYEHSILHFTGDITTNMSIVLPSTPSGRQWTVFNQTSGAFTLVMKASTGAGTVTIAQTKKAIIYGDSTDGIIRVTADNT